MTGLRDIVQKAFYLGVGIADYAAEKAGGAFHEIAAQGQKLADEMVSRGEMTTEEARKFVDDLVKQAQEEARQPSEDAQSKEPRLIEIVAEDEETAQPEHEDVEALRRQVQALQDELRKLSKD
jgi:polyhydroxyalkanoate synthesis regulator phasin